MSYKITKIETTPLVCKMDHPIKGTITCHAFIHTKDRVDEIFTEAQNYEKRASDEWLLKKLYKSLDGMANDDGPLVGDAAFHEVVYGEFNGFLIPALINTYMDQYDDARAGNSKLRRFR